MAVEHGKVSMRIRFLFVAAPLGFLVLLVAAACLVAAPGLAPRVATAPTTVPAISQSAAPVTIPATATNTPAPETALPPAAPTAGQSATTGSSVAAVANVGSRVMVWGKVSTCT